jgi:hypothetical protein
VVTELVTENGLGKIDGKRRLNDAGKQAVDVTAAQTAELVDGLLQKHWNRTAGAMEDLGLTVIQEPVQATCSCGSGIPVQDVQIYGQTVTLIALPIIFQQLHQAGKPPSAESEQELFEAVKIYNPIAEDDDEAYKAVLLQEYAAFCSKEGDAR